MTPSQIAASISPCDFMTISCNSRTRRELEPDDIVSTFGSSLAMGIHDRRRGKIKRCPLLSLSSGFASHLFVYRPCPRPAISRTGIKYKSPKHNSAAVLPRMISAKNIEKGVHAYSADGHSSLLPNSTVMMPAP